ncbi:MAG: homocysteine S-methyltransferase family protein [Chloroflexi bacterium]|nr:homocysteine S-methyltransferase family protein [Chloroflexota bacterium]
MKIRRFELALGADVLVCDGAMGTLLMQSGAMTGPCPEEVTLTAPEVVKDIHRRYAEAGADIVETATFGGSRIKLSKSGLADRTVEINETAARIAREAVGDGIIVAGDIGPLGEFLQPLGDITYEAAVDAFAEQAKALADGGVDVIIAETLSDLQEARAAIEGAKAAADLPVICTMTFETHLHTIMGVSPADAAVALRSYGADLIGANCGTGPAEFETIIVQMMQAAPDMFIAVQPNAGLPELAGEDVIWRIDPEEMASYAARFKQLGVKIIGACCGSTPDHIRAIARAVKGH